MQQRLEQDVSLWVDSSFGGYSTARRALIIWTAAAKKMNGQADVIIIARHCDWLPLRPLDRRG